jgi:hypothetical protein
MNDNPAHRWTLQKLAERETCGNADYANPPCARGYSTFIGVITLPSCRRVIQCEFLI